MGLCLELVAGLTAVLIAGKATTRALFGDLDLLLFEEHARQAVFTGGADHLDDSSAHTFIAWPSHSFQRGVVSLFDALSE